MIIWQQNSNNLDNADNFALINQWWSNLAGKEIYWQQRLIPASGNLTEINWETQHFDEKFTPITAQIRGITIYWQKPETEEERSLTPSKLELDPQQQKLYIYPQSQPQLIICISLTTITYQTFSLTDPQIAGISRDDKCIILLRDSDQKIEIKLTLSRTGIGRLLESLPG
jgi:hypothetical protein